jgi:drug/metabolite transporter (DMT)-like permease
MIAIAPYRTALATLAMVGSAAAWGSATVLTKGILEFTPPFTLLSLQMTASVTVLALAVLMQGRWPRRDAEARRAGLTGLLEPGLAYAVGVPGVALTTAGSASLIAATEPAIVVLVAWVVLSQRPDRRIILAILAAMIGVALVTATGSGGEDGDRRLTGDLLILLGTGFAALYVVLSSRHVARIAPLDLALAQQAVGLVFVLGVTAGVIALGLEPPTLPSGPALLLALGSGVLQYALPFWLYLTAVQVIAVSRAALYLTLTPVFGLLGGVAFLGETVAPVQAVGAAITLAAITAVARRQA